VTSPLYVYPYRTGCRKIPYLTEADAKEAIRDMRQHNKHTRGLEAYMCRWCPGNPWHIGHPKWLKANRSR
jgi:hypothetical protein